MDKLKQLARDRTGTFQELADEVFADPAQPIFFSPFLNRGPFRW